MIESRSYEELALRQIGQDQESERLYRRWVRDLLRGAQDDLTPRAWDRLMCDIGVIAERYDTQREKPE